MRGRHNALEQQLPPRVEPAESAGVLDDGPQLLTVDVLLDALADRDARLDRHRDELERLKERLNDLSRYVGGITDRETTG